MPDHLFPCENCGAQLRFAPGQTSLTCPNCGHVQAIPEAEAEETTAALQEIDFSEVIARLEANAPMAEHRVLTCPNCGAQTEFPESTQATTCPFCATPLIAEAAQTRQIRPTAVVPFGLTEAHAREAMTDWLGRLWFAPNGLREYARKGRRMTGIYVPFWTFDAQTETDYRGQRGTNHTVHRTVMRNGKSERVAHTEIRWRSVSGHVSRFFDDVLVLASTSLPKAHTDALEPWDLRALAPYRPDYLSGFAAEGYHVGLRDGFTEARAVMDRVIDQDIRRDIGGDHQRITAKHPIVTDVTFKHVLLPVWMAAYKYDGRSFRFVVNGQTGKVQGERPWSRWKIALAVVAGLILAGLLAWGYQWGVANGYIQVN